MQCPFDASELTVVNRSGIEIDWCPSCKGVWLERGELDKLIDLASAGAAPQAGQPQPQPQFQPPAPAYQPAPGPGPQPAYQQPPPQRRYNDSWPDDMYDRDSSGRTYRTHRKHKRKGILGDIFDF